MALQRHKNIQTSTMSRRYYDTAQIQLHPASVLDVLTVKITLLKEGTSDDLLLKTLSSVNINQPFKMCHYRPLWRCSHCRYQFGGELRSLCHPMRDSLQSTAERCYARTPTAASPFQVSAGIVGRRRRRGNGRPSTGGWIGRSRGGGGGGGGTGEGWKGGLITSC